MIFIASVGYVFIFRSLLPTWHGNIDQYIVFHYIEWRIYIIECGLKLEYHSPQHHPILGILVNVKYWTQLSEK